MLKILGGWFARNIVLFALAFVALLSHAIWERHGEQIAAWFHRDDSVVAEKRADLNAERADLANKIKLMREAEASLAKREAEATTELRQFERRFASQSEAVLRRERSEILEQRDQIDSDMPSAAEQLLAVTSQDSELLEEIGRKRISLVILERQLEFIDTAISLKNGTVERVASNARLAWTNAKDEVERECKRLEQARKYWRTKRDLPFFNDLRGRVDGSRRDALARMKAATQSCREAIRNRNLKKNALDTANRAVVEARAKINSVVSGSSRDISNARSSAEARLTEIASMRLEAEVSIKSELASYDYVGILKTALLILLGIIAMPFVIRIIFYYILAPLAERRAAIRIAIPGHKDVKIPPSELSRVSIPVTLDKGEELLVRQDYLQTSSLEGGKSTRWLLDYRHILSSIASGLTFLTRIRSAGETTTVSAVRDPFAELTQVILPEGSACVLQPRALVAVVQPTGRTMRITSHWRLFSLNAWLTMQLRYLVFHGPGRLIVMGGRGIRVEHAERGRIFGQDQLVGFSSDLAYSVTRTETFWPYFFGREQLFKDKVQQGNGVIIIEEAPLSSRKGTGVKRGLEGAFDAGLKVFGI